MNQRTKEFLSDLEDLLRKHEVTATVEESVHGYGTYVEGINFYGYTPAIEEDNFENRTIDITFSRYLDAEEVQKVIDSNNL